MSTLNYHAPEPDAERHAGLFWGAYAVATVLSLGVVDPVVQTHLLGISADGVTLCFAVASCLVWTFVVFALRRRWLGRMDRLPTFAVGTVLGLAAVFPGYGAMAVMFG